MPAKHQISGTEFRPLHKNVFVTLLDSGPHKTSGGIIIPDDNLTERGIRDRWGKVCAIGPEIDDLYIGEWVLVKHGRWTLGIEMNINGSRQTVWRIEYPDAILLISSDDPREVKPTSF